MSAEHLYSNKNKLCFIHFIMFFLTLLNVKLYLTTARIRYLVLHFINLVSDTHRTSINLIQDTITNNQ